MSRFIAPLGLLLCLFTAVTTTFGQFGQNNITKPTTFAYSVSPTKAKVGDVIEIRITARSKEGWHMYAAKTNPKLEMGPQATTVALEKNKTFQPVGELVSVGYETKFDDVWEGDTYIMPNPAIFTQKVKLLTDKPVIKGTLEGQTCSTVCVQVSDEFDVSSMLTVAAAAPESLTTATATAPASTTVVSATNVPETDSATAKVSTADTIAAAATSVAPVAGEVDPLATSGEQGDSTSLWGFALAAFLSGLAALLTPCVFPIIPMTVSFFTHQKGGWWKALLYGASIIAIYVLIGTLVSRINGPAFANFLSTHWIPNLLFFAVFFIFGLSFLGLFEITLPSSIVNKADAASERGGLAGIFFMAFTLVLVSFSCTGPIVGSLLVASAGGAVIKPIIGMAAFSSAFAIPFTLFALFPQWLQKLPKSGGWLNSVKVVLGFLELALALKFLSIADQVYHWNLLDREVYLSFWIVIFSLIGFYLLGKIRLPHDSDEMISIDNAATGTMRLPVANAKVSVFRMLLAIITFTFVVYMVPGLWGAPLKALAGYLPPETTQDFNLQRAGGPGQGVPANQRTVRHGELFKMPHGIPGFFDYKEALAYSKTVNRPVFIDFTGHGCVNCREMEQRVWSDPAILSRLQNDYVVVALYVDDKTELPEGEWYTSNYDQKTKKTIGAQNGDLQITRYGNNAQPHYCLVDGEGKLLVTPINYDLNIEKFGKFLDSGKAAFASR
ncbi:protein-disulfide reductase DsbD family protein [Fibrivirga algicola]|uniref:Disulfide bond formation protein DsbD n=1 Tax=Fibrivirga algicola TaxID=2950420 RepID=A0ABX0QCQ7_9BACT|nr:thioredoxin family protein [Fibrivirga algicola]NID10181.1 disulfide bond formation protein DsbD [Fibrivirga algicola]